MENKKSIFDQLDSKNTTLLGFVGSILTLGTVGFIVLGIYTLKAGASADSIGTYNANSIEARQPSNGQNQPENNEPSGIIPSVSEADHIRGDKNSPVTIIEYSDFECPFCQRFHQTLQKIVAEYDGQVRWVYRHFPLTSIHQNAQKLAEGSECATEFGGNDAFWAYSEAIFSSNNYSNDALVKIATNIGIKSDKFLSCLTGGKYTETVQSVSGAGLSAGVTGTPGSFVIGKNGEAQLVSGALPYESIKKVIDIELAR